MTSEDVRKAIVAFLNQFIERGAASDVVALRDRLRDDPVSGRAEIASLLSGDDVTALEAYEAMRCLFLTESSPTSGGKGPPLVLLHSWTRIEEDGDTSDPAQWDDWLGSLATLDNA